MSRRHSVNRPPTPDVQDDDDDVHRAKEPSLLDIVNIKLIESGEKERLMELVRERLVECGWKDEMRAICRIYRKTSHYGPYCSAFGNKSLKLDKMGGCQCHQVLESQNHEQMKVANVKVVPGAVVKCLLAIPSVPAAAGAFEPRKQFPYENNDKTA